MQIAQWPEVYQRVAALRPQDERLWIGLARHHGSHGRWQQAAEALEKVVEHYPEDHFGWYVMGPLQYRLGDMERYRRVCDEMLQRWPRNPYKPVQIRAVKVCLLDSDVPAERLERLIEMADDAIANVPEGTPQGFYLARGLAAYRAGELEDARQWLEECVPGSPYCESSARLILAMIDERGQMNDKARRDFQKTLEAIDERLPKLGPRGPGTRFHEWLICDILRREAEQTLGFKTDEKQATEAQQE
jgi:tetratricopeptide (TPR) repeat protein